MQTIQYEPSCKFVFTLLFHPPALSHAGDTEELEPPIHPCLWKIIGKGLTKPSWFFGTVHSSNPRLAKLHPKAEAAFTSSQKFYFEAEFEGSLPTDIISRKDGITFSESVGPTIIGQLRAELHHIHPKAVHLIRRWQNDNTLIPALYLPSLDSGQLKRKPPLDFLLYSRARKDGKACAGLETRKQQLKCLAAFTEEERIAILAGILKNIKEARARESQHNHTIDHIYLTGKPKDIVGFLDVYKLEDRQDLTDILIYSLVGERNKNISSRVDDILSRHPDESHFFAVGAAHCTGKHALQKLLESQGYIVVPEFDE